MRTSRSTARPRREGAGALARVALALAVLLLAPGIRAAPGTEGAGPGGADGGANLSPGSGPVVVLELEGPIGPATSDFLKRGFERARALQAPAIVLRMDTPGGLDTAMREIIREILASPIPVVAWVAPSGARAASAGTYILYAAHVAAMAPATNLGAATPIPMGPGALPGPGGEPEGDRPGATDRHGAPRGGEGGREAPEGESGAREKKQGEPEDRPPPVASPATSMQRKIVNDAVAYIRGLARLRGRNAEWAERAVREGASLTAEDALEKGVIDLIAPDLPTLLERVDGRAVRIGEVEHRLKTAGRPVETIAPDWRNRLLSLLTNPNVAYVLMLLGIYGLFFELANPGAIAPGVIGTICLVLALYAFHVLPVNYAGLALVMLGVAFMVAEAFLPSFGALGIGGAIAFVVGSFILMDTEAEAFQISRPLIFGVAAGSVAFFLLVVSLALRQRRRPVRTGREEMVGLEGEAWESFQGRGRVWVHGELWFARSDVPLEKGQRVRVREVDGLTLVVEPVEHRGGAPGGPPEGTSGGLPDEGEGAGTGIVSQGA